MDDFSRSLVEAMQFENDGYHHYTTAAQRTEDPKAKQMFGQLAEDELSHHKTLELMFSDHQKQGSLKLKPPRIKSKVDPAQESPIFSPEFKERVGDKHYEMSALSIGILLEQNSIESYKIYRRQAKELKIKRLFNALIRWEELHLEALIKQQQFLQQAYWEANRFAPF
jgi:rubrerythrin